MTAQSAKLNPPCLASKAWRAIYVHVFFFFSSRRRHTRFDCDWSSDVCSSDLPGWQEVLDALASLSRSRARQGFTPAQTANFIFSLKRPLFALLRKETGSNGEDRKSVV